MPVNVTPENIQITGTDAVSLAIGLRFVETPISDATREEVWEQAEVFLLERREKVAERLADIATHPYKPSWLHPIRRRRFARRRLEDQARLERFEQEPPIILEGDRYELTRTLYEFVDSSFIPKTDFKLTMSLESSDDLIRYFQEEADGNARYASEAEAYITRDVPDINSDEIMAKGRDGIRYEWDKSKKFDYKASVVATYGLMVILGREGQQRNLEYATFITGSEPQLVQS